MRTKLSLLTAVAAAAFLAADGGLIVAQAAQPMVVAANVIVAANVADTVEAKNLVGQTVVDAEGKTLGKVESVLIDPAGKVKYLIVGVGGFLGIGEKDVALRWDDLQTKTSDKLVANVTKEQLTTMPAYRYGDASRRGTVYSYDQDLTANPYLADNLHGTTATNNSTGNTAAPADATISTKDLLGRSVVDPRGNSVGKIDSALIDDSGKVKYLIVGVGGFLGIGEKDVALRWDDLQQKNANQLVSNMTKEQLKAMPTYRYSDAKRRGTIYPYRQDLTANPYLAEGVAPINSGATVSTNAAATANVITADAKNLVGRSVVDSQGKSLGKVDSVLVDAGGKVKYVIVGVGGFLGIGEKDVALRWDDLQNQGGDRIVANVTKDQLTSLPGYRYGNASRRGTVYPYSEDLAANPYLAKDQPDTGVANNAKTSTSSNGTMASNEVPPFPGANSFTESQARSRIEEQGFTAVTGLKKDDQGIWRGTAMKNGKTVSVALDYKGNVVVQ
jgi:sporulation protein YlmC with PRC-barrel domain